MKRLLKTNITRWPTLLMLIALVAINLPNLPAVHAADGDLDTMFGAPNGFVTLSDSTFFDVVIQPADGKIVAAGVRGPSLLVARFNTNGTPDSTFGNGGAATATTILPTGATAIAIQPDGKIVAAGDIGVSQDESDFFVMRFDVSGNPDPGFGQNGSVSIKFSGVSETSLASSLVIEPGGRIVVAGHLKSNPPQIEIARLNNNGSLDMSFGIGGKVITEQATGASFQAGLAETADGHILVAGGAVVNGSPDFGLWRYNNNGTIDATFGGGDGLATVDFVNSIDTVQAMAVQPDGRIVLFGQAGTQDALARFDSNGNLDPDFNENGKVVGTMLQGNISARDLVLQADGEILTVGTVLLSGGADQRVLVSRYHSFGSPDQTFGNDGRVMIDLTPSNERGEALALQTDGKIVVAGHANAGFSDAGLVVRYNGSVGPPAPQPAFDICAQSGSLTFRLNSITGAYEFSDCAKGTVLTGAGTLSKIGCKLYLNDSGPNKSPDRTISVAANTCTRAATVSVTIKSLSKTYGFTDSDITQGSCLCP